MAKRTEAPVERVDPAIGNIKHQPQSAIREVEQLIKQTWEYRFLVRFDIIKVAIARGVTLKRSDIYKAICNKIPKPEDINDHTWRIMSRDNNHLKNIKKSQNCRKANACCKNFGRTRPVGEAGVRHRLMSELGRAPDPDEVRLEMSRNKGYGDQSKNKGKSQFIMHGSADASTMISDVGTTSAKKDIFDDVNLVANIPSDVTIISRPGFDLSMASTNLPTTTNHQASCSTPVEDTDWSGDPYVKELLDKVAALEAANNLLSSEAKEKASSSRAAECIDREKTLLGIDKHL